MKYRTQKVGRDAATGLFIKVAAARKNKRGAVVETVRIPVKKKAR